MTEQAGEPLLITLDQIEIEGADSAVNNNGVSNAGLGYLHLHCSSVRRGLHAFGDDRQLSVLFKDSVFHIGDVTDPGEADLAQKF